MASGITNTHPFSLLVAIRPQIESKFNAATFGNFTIFFWTIGKSTLFLTLTDWVGPSYVFFFTRLKYGPSYVAMLATQQIYPTTYSVVSIIVFHGSLISQFELQINVYNNKNNNKRITDGPAFHCMLGKSIGSPDAHVPLILQVRLITI